jgi:hypothetical protein
MQQQSRALSVALHSHLRSAFATALATVNAIDGKLAQGISPERERVERGPAAHNPAEPIVVGSSLGAAGASAAPRRANYALRLGTAYAVTPVLALMAGQALSRVVPSGELAVMGGGLLLLLPPSIHIAHGATERAWRAVVFMVACTALMSTSGAAIGYAIGKASCDPDLSGECGLTALAWVLVGAAIGGLLGYIGHARRDVVLHSSVPDPAAPAHALEETE